MTETDDFLSAICRRRLLPLAVLLFLSLLALPGCEKKATPQKAPEEAKPVSGEGFRTSRNDRKEIDINLKEIRLAVIPEDYDKWGLITFSADGRQVFYVARKKDRDFIVVATTGGEKTGPAYEGISFLVNSPDGRRFAVGGRKGEKKYLVVDNKELRDLYHEEVGPSAFSPDGRFVASEVGIEEKTWFIVVTDGENEVYRSPAYPDTFRGPAFSPDGRLLVFELGDVKAKTENYKRTIFFLDVSTWKIIKERLYIGSQTGSFSFSSDSTRVVYNAQKEGKNFLVLLNFALNEERTVALPYNLAGRLVLSPDGKHIFYAATKGEKYYLVINPWEAPARGKESGPYDGVSSVVFSPGSTTFAYSAMKDGKWRTIVGDREGAKYDGVGDGPPVFSPNGLKIAYPARKGGYQDRSGVVGGKWAMVVSSASKPAAVKEGPAYDMVVTPVFSPDGKYIAYRARLGTMENAKRFIVIADAETGKVIKEGRVGDEVWPPVWSADGKTAAYGARLGRELWWRVEKLGE